MMAGLIMHSSLKYSITNFMKSLNNKVTKYVVLLCLAVSIQVMADTVWIDVRTADEYATGHVPGALLMPYDQIAQLITTQVSDKNTDIQVYCRSGRRADAARATLLQMGYTQVTNNGSYEDALSILAAKVKSDREQVAKVESDAAEALAELRKQ